MKWGIRRWQNSDGTFNEAGKDRYFSDGAGKDYKPISDRPRSSVEGNKRKYTKEDLERLSDEYARRIEEASKNAKKEEDKKGSKSGKLTKKELEMLEQRKKEREEKKKEKKEAKKAYESYKKKFEEIENYNNDNPNGPWKVINFKPNDDDEIGPDGFAIYEVNTKEEYEKVLEYEKRYLKALEDGDEELGIVGYKNIKHSDIYTTENGSEFLVHYGAKGQKWGVRRWQNPDGSLTSAGRKHYGVGDPRVSKSGERKHILVKNMSESELRDRIARQKLENEYREQQRLGKATRFNERDRRADEKRKNAAEDEALRAQKASNKIIEKNAQQGNQNGQQINKQSNQNLQQNKNFSESFVGKTLIDVGKKTVTTVASAAALYAAKKLVTKLIGEELGGEIFGKNFGPKEDGDDNTSSSSNSSNNSSSPNSSNNSSSSNSSSFSSTPIGTWRPTTPNRYNGSRSITSFKSASESIDNITSEMLSSGEDFMKKMGF